jgi:dihydroorotase
MRRPELGSLRPGSAADVALFRLEEGEYQFHDVHMNARTGTQRLVNTLTMVGGEELPRLPERPLHSWSVLPEHQAPYQKPLGPQGRVGRG